jgi:hypothetical protein
VHNRVPARRLIGKVGRVRLIVLFTALAALDVGLLGGSVPGLFDPFGPPTAGPILAAVASVLVLGALTAAMIGGRRWACPATCVVTGFVVFLSSFNITPNSPSFRMFDTGDLAGYLDRVQLIDRITTAGRFLTFVAATVAFLMLLLPATRQDLRGLGARSGAAE